MRSRLLSFFCDYLLELMSDIDMILVFFLTVAVPKHLIHVGPALTVVRDVLLASLFAFASLSCNMHIYDLASLFHCCCANVLHTESVLTVNGEPFL